ncbi:DUF3742 family protein [Pseudomonas granadensis]|uniref:DUF3742 family protein n=1 Tax=Pseudomonas granadensis TaxID=1421430 RepID=A0ABX7G9M9_9PSED|nr:DUF3742 family protein [Pseudomonas granadensis]QRK81786.1 DUF3742 family protein [Pseudomonas granadensis]
MATSERGTAFSILGKWLGRLWLRMIQIDERISSLIEDRRMPDPLVSFLKWGLRLALLLLLIISALGLSAVALLILFSAKMGSRPVSNDEDWAIGEQYDQRDDPFYDPINDSRMIDPRFEDD